MKIKTWFFINEVTSSRGTRKEFCESGILDQSGKVTCLLYLTIDVLFMNVTKPFEQLFAGKRFCLEFSKQYFAMEHCFQESN